MEEERIEKVISDTQNMFIACACMALHQRNGFGKNRLLQFIADIAQINKENEYDDIRAALKAELDIDMPEVS